MIRRLASSVVALLVVFPCVAFGSTKLSGKPQGAEVAFVSSVQHDLDARFSTPAKAEAAGYFRYSNEDDTGAISYANLHWHSRSPRYPSQLWYSVKGKLLGADFSVPTALSPQAPHLWGVNPQRWFHIPAHIHYVLNVNGKMSYELATSVKKFAAAGGNINDPQAATLVKMGLAKNTAQVAHVFLYPSIWDLTVWVYPNPNGAFANKNPLVKPSMEAAKDSM
jgi:hypothetical protein